ncbi:hypothetical protein B0I35DRAFT_435978 [Stachybotrys elegans]|uniref:Transcription factor domain-containing protein n=1 Tax=Stachybotrys elegans TaxID=80388 RepID=A0A8K0WPA7_9HYPO|nr:hypothetical protein B0I35DRAFT_435978 [Stachybotrys elegans]
MSALHGLPGTPQHARLNRRPMRAEIKNNPDEAPLVSLSISASTSPTLGERPRLGDDDEQHEVLRQQLARSRKDLISRVFDGRTTVGPRSFTISIARLEVPRSVGGLDTSILCLPMQWNRFNREMIRLHIGLTSRFKASIDGSMRSCQAFNELWAPFCVQDRTMLQVMLYGAACFSYEARSVPKAIVLQYKAAVYCQLQACLEESPGEASVAATMATAQMLLASWYWGTTEDVRQHRVGLKRMIASRGGLGSLGLMGYLAKMVTVNDITMALAHETQPTIFDQPDYDLPEESDRHHGEIRYNTPLAASRPPFAGTDIRPQTARILDNLRAIIKGLCALREPPVAQELDKVLEQTLELYGMLEGPLAVLVVAAPNKTGEAFHECIRRTARLYCRAILARSPTSLLCSREEFSSIWRAMRKVPLGSWDALAGLMIWVLVALVPSSHSQPEARTLRTALNVAMMATAVNDWNAVVEAARSAFKFQRWVKGEAGSAAWTSGVGDEVHGGEGGVDEHGLCMKTWTAEEDETTE